MASCRITVVTLPHGRGPTGAPSGSPGKGLDHTAFSNRPRSSSKPPGRPGSAQKSLLSLLPGRPGLHPARHKAGDPCRPGQVRPAWQGGGAPQGAPPFVFSYFFRFSATSSAMCETLTFMPCFSTPPRSCMTQPGQSMTTREAPVSSMCFSFLASSVPEISGNFME